MPHLLNIVLSPEIVADEALLKQAISEKTGISPKNIFAIQIVRRSIDARGRKALIRLELKVFEIGESNAAKDDNKTQFIYKNVSNAETVLIAGAGPAGLFAALRLIELGLKPVIIERGKDIRSRRRDLALLNRLHIVDPNSNYCFGEGGAGTYSDGKLYTRSTKRGDTNRILDIFVNHGASTEIKIESHPHIGTNKLPGIIEAMRQTILDAGGEIHFQIKLTDFIHSFGTFIGIMAENTTSQGNAISIKARAIILATGHSARDIFRFLHERKISIQLKPFALGLRVEHPQSIIDNIQYHCQQRHPLLPPATYSLVHQVGGRGVFSFCMCPGGIIAPCATEQGQVVTNGWSPSKRNNPFANSGIVVAVNEDDIPDRELYGALAAMMFQENIEKKACLMAGGTQAAPAQRLTDFVNKKQSSTLPKVSYQPGVSSIDLHQVLPAFVADRIREGLIQFGKQMRGFYTEDAVLLGVESRTSSPVRIPRDRVTLQHPEIAGLFPCGEGAGYAGGIMSAAVDGERCAEMCAVYLRT